MNSKNPTAGPGRRVRPFKTMLLNIIEIILPMALFVFLAFADEHNIIMEDQFITLSYSRNLAEGAGLVFNPGERVEGFSNPLWVFIMAPAFLLGLNALVYNRIICILAALAHFPIISSIIRKYCGTDCTMSLRLMPQIILALSFPFIFWTKSGMETPFASLLLLCGVWLLISRRPLSGSLFLGLLAVTRPEGIIYMAIAVLIPLLEKERDLKKYIRAVLPGLLIFLAYEVFRTAYFHDWLPNSFHAKVSLASLAEKRQGLVYYKEWLMSVRGAALLAALAVLAGRRAAIAGAAPWLAVLFLDALFIVAVGGDFVGGNFMPHFRFIVPALPAAAITVGMGAICLFRYRLPEYMAKRRRILAAILLAAAIIFHPDSGRQLKVAVYAFARPPDLPVPPPTPAERLKELWLTRTRQPNLFVAEWLRKNLPGATIATAECGIIPYVSRVKIVDIYGLMDREMAKRPLSQKPALLMSMEVEYLLLLFSLDPPSPTLIPEIFSRRDFRDNYCVAAVFASCDWRRGSPGYILFERAPEQGRECIHSPQISASGEIIDWLGNMVENDAIIECWDYSYDVFR